MSRSLARRRLSAATLAAALGLGPAAAFDEFPLGARPAALGGAFTAVADDVHSVSYNPAGLADLSRPEVSAYYARLFPDLSDQTRTALTFIGAAGPLPRDGRWGGLGLAYDEFRVDDLYKERSLSLGYGRRLFLDRLRLGIALRSLGRSFGSTADTENAFTGTNPGNRTGVPDPVFANGRSQSALGVDLGALYGFSPAFNVGLAVKNVNQPDLGLATGDRLPFVTRLGAAYRRKTLLATADLVRRSILESEDDTRLHLGAERGWAFRRYGVLSLRGGTGIGNRDFRQVTAGLGYEVNGIGLDYVFTVPLGAADDTGNTHNVSLSYRFGRAPAEDELEALILVEKAATERALESLRLAEAEAAFVREERARLMAQYAAEIERLKGDLENARSNGSVAAPVPARVLSAQDRERLARERALREFTAAYEAAMRSYMSRAERTTLSERINVLNGIIRKYTDTGVNLSRAKNELEKVKSEMARVSTDYRITMDFYKKTVAQGADAAERISLLERMIKKYARAGIDISEATEELAKLKSSR